MLTTAEIGVNFTYLGALLMANMPQIILSFCFFSLDALFTRLQAEKEWNSYSLSYKPLRVSRCLTRRGNKSAITDFSYLTSAVFRSSE